MFHPPGRLLDWAKPIADICEFIHLCHFLKVHENFLWHCLRVSVPQESPSIFVMRNKCNVLFSFKSYGYLQPAKQTISTIRLYSQNGTEFKINTYFAIFLKNHQSFLEKKKRKILQRSTCESKFKNDSIHVFTEKGNQCDLSLLAFLIWRT